jgi:hypothetical protein
MWTICRVCGTEFFAPRRDALTCTSTCRQRLHRGGTFAYFANLTAKQQRAQRELHDANDAALAAHKGAVAATRALRDLKRMQRLKRAERVQRQVKAEQERERLLAEFTGRAYIAAEKKKREQGLLAIVASVLKLFAKQHRNDTSAEAIAEFLDMPDAYPVEDIARARTTPGMNENPRARGICIAAVVWQQRCG